MASQDRMERLRRALTDASRRLDRQPQSTEERPFAGVMPGDLFVFRTPVHATIEWLVVREHPDDRSLVLLVPADDFPLAGRCDISLKPEFIHRPLTVRCGEAVWVSAATCAEQLRVGAIPSEAVAEVRRKLAALARGIVPDGPDTAPADDDPEFMAWLQQIAVARAAMVNVAK